MAPPTSRQLALKRSRSKQAVPVHAVPAPPNPDQDWENYIWGVCTLYGSLHVLILQVPSHSIGINSIFVGRMKLSPMTLAMV